jgi:hypothetical protein
LFYDGARQCCHSASGYALLRVKKLQRGKITEVKLKAISVFYGFITWVKLLLSLRQGFVRTLSDFWPLGHLMSVDEALGDFFGIFGKVKSNDS